MLRSWVVLATLAMVSPGAVADEHIDNDTRVKCAIERAYCLRRYSADNETLQLSADEQFERFQLFNFCEPMNLFVNELPQKAADVGLTKGSIQAAVESRLRSARLYDSEASFYLGVAVHILDSAFSVDFKFNKRVLDYSSNSVFMATTWNNGGVGIHTNKSEYILSIISRQMDEFLVEYLRINESECGKR